MNRRMLSSSQGMTLIETLIASAIGIILSGIIIIIYLLFDAQVKENNAYLTMQMQYENLSEQIAFNARRAHKIIDASSAYHDTCNISEDTLTAIKFYNVAGTLIGGIRLNNDTINEVDQSGAWVPFKTGNGTVCARGTSRFILNGCGKSIALDLTLKFTDRDSTFYLDARKDEFLCRN